MKKMLFFLGGVVVIATLLQGCATALSKSEYTVDVVTKKPNAHFMVYNRKGEYVHQGTTPMLVTLKAQSENFTKEIYTIKTTDGGTTKSRTLTATITPIYWGNVLGFIGFAVDGVTGAMWALPSRVNLDMEQKDDIVSQNSNL
jgi:hypothetical protein